MRRIGDYAIGYQGDEDEFENYIDEYPIATKREIWEQAHRAGFEEGKKQAAQECYKMVCSDEYVFGARNLAKAIKSKFGLEGVSDELPTCVGT